MDPKLTEQLQQTLAALLANAQDAAAWTTGQIPLLVQDKIFIGRIEHTAAIVVSIVVMLGCAWIVRKLSRMDGGNVDYEMAQIFMGIGCIAGFAAVLINFHVFLIVWFAPRLYIVEWLTSQVRL